MSSRKIVKVSTWEQPNSNFKCSKRSVRIKMARSRIVEDADPCVQTWMYASVSFCLTVEIVVEETAVVVAVVAVVFVEVVIVLIT